MTSKKTSILWVLVALASGIVAGLCLSSQLIHFQIEVDYDSGHCRERILLGPIVVREQPSAEIRLGSIIMPTGTTALTGTEDWHVAQSFRGNSKYSPNYRAGKVLSYIVQLENLPWPNKHTTLAKAKQDFLEALAKDSSAATYFVNQLYTRISDDERQHADGASPQ